MRLSLSNISMTLIETRYSWK